MIKAIKTKLENFNNIQHDINKNLFSKSTISLDVYSKTMYSRECSCFTSSAFADNKHVFYLNLINVFCHVYYSKGILIKKQELLKYYNNSKDI